MLKKTLALIFVSLFFTINTPLVWADAKGAGEVCDTAKDTCPAPNYSCQKYDSKTYLCLSRILSAGDTCDPRNTGVICPSGYDCQFDNVSKTDVCLTSTIVGTIFGRIRPPAPLASFLQKDSSGTGAISQFLSNLVSLIFALAALVLVFMIIWGAFDWLISEGDKEKIQGAQKKIISAIVGSILLAIAFALLRVFGQFTGFTFFEGQDYKVLSRNRQLNIEIIECRDTKKTTLSRRIGDTSVKCP